MYCYQNSSHEWIVATLRLLRYFKAFIDSDCSLMPDPINDGFTLTKQQARDRLTYMVHVAINRRGGMWNRYAPLNHSGKPYRKFDTDYQTHLYRDSNRLRDIGNRIRVYQFESPEANARFKHLLSSRYDD